MYDAADAVRGLRAEGHTVLLHCVAGEQRTPSVAVAYGVLLGHGADETRQAVRAALAPRTRVGASVGRREPLQPICRRSRLASWPGTWDGENHEGDDLR